MSYQLVGLLYGWPLIATCIATRVSLKLLLCDLRRGNIRQASHETIELRYDTRERWQLHQYKGYVNEQLLLDIAAYQGIVYDCSAILISNLLSTSP
jgi:hypothetical protein